MGDVSIRVCLLSELRSSPHIAISYIFIHKTVGVFLQGGISILLIIIYESIGLSTTCRQVTKKILNFVLTLKYYNI